MSCLYKLQMRGVGQELAYVESASNVWNKAIQARRVRLARTHDDVREHRDCTERTARNKTIQVGR